MNRIFRSTVIVMTLTFVGQLINFVTQMIVAYLFGANASMDAYNAAFAFPQYINMTLLSSLGFVFLPVFVGYITSERPEDGWRMASSSINLCVIVVGMIVLIGMVTPSMVLHLITPGLPEPTQKLASHLSIILWPSVLATGLTILLTVIYHSESRFGWPSFVPVVGAGTSLLLTVILAKKWGILGFAYGTTFGSFLQLLLLLPIVIRPGRYKFILDLKHEGIGHLIHLLVPLLLANIFGKATSLVERYLASSMQEGTISQLGYALRSVTMISFLFSSGLGAVLFQRMAIEVSSDDLQSLRRTISTGLRYLWLAVAPVLTLGIALSFPLISIIFHRGEFSQADTQSVSRLFQVYMLSLAASCFGNITARGFYVLRDTATIAWMTVIESIAYVIYTAFLANRYGPLGIALGYVLLFNVSFGWQSLFITFKTGKVGGGLTLLSFLRTSFPAVIAGLVAWGIIRVVSGDFLQIIIGGLAGIIVYLSLLLALRSPEGWSIVDLLVKTRKFGMLE